MTVEETPGLQVRNGGFRFSLDLAALVVVILQLGGVIWFASAINQQVVSLEQRMNAVEHVQADRSISLSDIAVQLGRIQQKLTDIGQKVGTDMTGGPGR